MADQAGPDWFLGEWLAAANKRQGWLADAVGIPKGKMSRLINGITHYRREEVNAIAAALNIEPYELLMSPAEAIALRKLREYAVIIAALSMGE